MSTSTGERQYPDFYYPKPEQFDDSDPRQRLQRIELETRLAISRATALLQEVSIRRQLGMLVAPIRNQIEPPLNLEKFNVSDSDVEAARIPLDQAAQTQADTERQKEVHIGDDARSIERSLTSIFSPAELDELTKGIAALKDIDQSAKPYEMRLGNPQATMYRDVTGELGIAFRLLYELYDTGVYEGPLRRESASLWGMTIPGGRGDELTPSIKLIPALKKRAARRILMSPIPAQSAEQKLLKGATERISALAAAVGQLARRITMQSEKPRNSVSTMRQNLLALISAEITEWEGRAAQPDASISLASWRLMQAYLFTAVTVCERIEKVQNMTADQLLCHLNTMEALARRFKEEIHRTTGFDTKYLGHEYRVEPPFDLHEFILTHFRQFMKLFNGLPFATEMERFAENQSLKLNPHVHDTLLAYYHFEYKYPTLFPNDEAKKRRIRSFEAGGDFVEDDVGNKPHMDVNPKIFYKGTRREQILYRLTESIARSDWKYQAAMLTGEGNALESETFAEALARKVWFMERKWRALSSENKKRWFEGEFCRTVNENGYYVDTVCLGADDYHTG